MKFSWRELLIALATAALAYFAGANQLPMSLLR